MEATLISRIVTEGVSAGKQTQLGVCPQLSSLHDVHQAQTQGEWPRGSQNYASCVHQTRLCDLEYTPPHGLSACTA